MPACGSPYSLLALRMTWISDRWGGRKSTARVSPRRNWEVQAGGSTFTIVQHTCRVYAPSWISDVYSGGVDLLQSPVQREAPGSLAFAPKECHSFLYGRKQALEERSVDPLGLFDWVNGLHLRGACICRKRRKSESIQPLTGGSWQSQLRRPLRSWYKGCLKQTMEHVGLQALQLALPAMLTALRTLERRIRD